MLKAIKDYFENLIISITGIDSAKVYRTLQEKTAYSLPPWASILTVSGKIDWQNLAHDKIKPPRVLKYTIPLVLDVTLAGKDEEVISGWKDSFLEQIPLQFQKDGIIAEVRVQSAEHTDSASKTRSFSAVSFLIQCEYGIYIDKDEINSQYVVLA